MSNFLSIAAVTATLQTQLQTQLAADVGHAYATVQRPDESDTDASTNPHVNIYLYQVVPNVALRNADLPTRRGEGGLAQRPRAAIDLHYLLTFHGDDLKHEPQRMLGSVVRFLHAYPTLTRQAVHDAIALSANADLALCDLEGESELVRFTPLPMSLEELSKLWSVFFQTRYMLSVAYAASVVLLEGIEAAAKPTPVVTSNIVVEQLAPPVIDEVSPPTVRIGDTLSIRGRNLRGQETYVRIGDVVVTPLGNVANDLVEISMSDAVAAGVGAGVRTAQIVHRVDFNGVPHPGFESNSVPFTFAPTITSATAAPDATEARRVNVTLGLDPPPRARQRVSLALDGMFTASIVFSTASVIPFLDLANGSYQAIAEVDGASSSAVTLTVPT